MPGSPIAAHGRTPVSLGIHGNTLVTADYALDRATPASDVHPYLNVLNLRWNGLPVWSAADRVTLPPASDPSQVLTTNTGPFVSESGFPSGSFLLSFARLQDGFLFSAYTVTPMLEGAAVPVLGLWANTRRISMPA